MILHDLLAEQLETLYEQRKIHPEADQESLMILEEMRKVITFWINETEETIDG